MRHFLFDLPGGVDPVQNRHIDIHDDDIGLERAGEFDGLPSISSLRHHLYIVWGLDHAPKPFPHHRMIIHEQDPDSSRTGGQPGSGHGGHCIGGLGHQINGCLPFDRLRFEGKHQGDTRSMARLGVQLESTVDGFQPFSDAEEAVLAGLDRILPL